MSTSRPATTSAGRPLSAGDIALRLMLCLSWGFNQIAVKLALPEISPFLQAFIRSCGAIVVLFLFVIMLLGVDQAENLQIEPFPLQRKTAALVGGGVIGLIVFAAISSRDNIGFVRPPQNNDVARVDVALHDGNIRRLARDLVTDHVLAFELTSVLLVIAVVGTVLLARRAPKSSIEPPA